MRAASISKPLGEPNLGSTGGFLLRVYRFLLWPSAPGRQQRTSAWLTHSLAYHISMPSVDSARNISAVLPEMISLEIDFTLFSVVIREFST